jgi:hypothetical protein
MVSELSGLEFDWFAIDGDGNLALFATAGEGFLPGSVGDHHGDHSELSDSLPAPRSGTPDVWKDYAALGLFVFDWALPGGPYEKRATPVGAASQALEKKVLALPQVPRFSGLFSNVAKVENWQ